MGSSPIAPTMKREDIYKLPKNAGIYCIKNTINGKCYIGQAIKIQKRLKAHFNSWNLPRYEHIVLYKAFKKYGIENFEVTILASFKDSLGWKTKVELDKLEKRYIEEYDSYNNGYNSTLGGDGGVHTDETKATVCGFDEDKKIVGEYENICDASNDNEVAFIVCGKCPDKDSEERVFDIPLTENMPTCPKDTI